MIVYSVDPEVPFSDDPPYIETGGLAGMMTPQGLQIASPEDSLPRLRIVTDGIVIVNVVFRVDITGPPTRDGWSACRTVCRTLPKFFGCAGLELAQNLANV